MGKEYLTFVHSIKDLPEGKEVKLLIRDLTPGQRKYDARYVKALLSSNPEQFEQGDRLWIRSKTGFLYPGPWAIKIIEELPEYVPGYPYMDIFEAIEQWE